MAVTSWIRRQFKNNVSVTDTIPTGMSSSATSCTSSDGSTFPDGSVGPFIVTIDQGLATEEKVLMTSRSGSVFTVAASGRGYNGTTAQTHAANATMLHTIDAQDMDEANQTMFQTLGAIAAKGDILVGSAANTLVKLGVGATNTTLQVVGGTLSYVGFGVGQSQSVAAANADGSQTTYARSDHAHLGVTSINGSQGVVTGFADLTSAQTLTNKRITRRVVAVTQSATPAINTNNTDVASITGLAQPITSMTTNLTGAPGDGDLLEVRITDNGTAQAITWGASFEASPGVPLPPTTTISTMLSVLFQWNVATSKWRTLLMDMALVNGPKSATVATTETTTSVTYADLPTPGPAVSVVTGANALVYVGAFGQNSLSGGFSLMAYAISGATTLAASDTTAAQQLQQSTIGPQIGSAMYLQSGLTPGVNTFTAKYRVTANTGQWSTRNIVVVPLP